MKKRGFTLVELLAIIVIIGIIALVATPLILKIIREAKKQAFLDTSYGIVESGYNYYSSKALKGQIITKKETIKFPNIGNTIKVKGKLPDAGSLEISTRGKVAIALYNKELKLCAIKEYDETEIRLEEMEEEECSAVNQIVADSKDGDIWAGWITLHLYYPENSEERMWRLDSRNGTRLEGIETWQPYTGPITIPLDRVEDIYIKYKIKGKTVIIGPKSLWVDIEPSSYKIKTGGKVTAKINYEETAETVEYKIGNSEWKDYEGEITVTKSTIIEARVTRNDKIYSSTGEVLGTQKVTEYDSVYIRNGDRTGEITPSEAEYLGSLGYKVNSVTGRPISSYEENLKEPTINVTPETKTEKVTVSITTPEEARKIYVKVGNSKYREYTEEFEVTENTNIYAYYIKAEDGSRSNTAHKRIRNIIKKGINSNGEEGNKPWVYIDADPYPRSYSKLVKSVEVTIQTEDADKVEYSYNGIEYEEYKGKLTIEENKRIYARATNEYGVTEEYLDITNIGDVIAQPAKRKNKLSVSITAIPEPELEENLIDKTKITIDYDKRATKKYYRIGYYGALKEYKGPFDMTENGTIYAYAISSNGEGETSKQITNLTTGISEPKITVTPSNSRAEKVEVSIKYDKNAKIKRYRINNEGLMDYTKEFTVSENSVIYAININELGQRAESRYEISNIVENMIYVLDKGEYFIIKLNYPEESKEDTREYKYGKNGTWEKYKTDGIMLIKGEYKDKIKVENEIEITDENGNKKIFKGDKYYVEGSISDIRNDIFMRWDTVKPSTPKITLNTEEPSKKVEAIIDYGEYVSKKEYKIVTPDGKDSGWKTYNGGIIIDRKNTVIYARSQNKSEVYSEIGYKKITNIDEEAPVIKLGADLETKTQSVLVKVNVTDDVKVDTVMYAKGLQGASYFSKNGEVILNNSMVKITENGTYTFYAKDGVGNEKTYSIIIENIDREAPKILINVEPELTIGLKAEVEIDYGDSKTKRYKIGKETKTWINYTEKIELDAYTILANKQNNSDGSVTVCAEGTDSVGNVNEVCKNIFSIDLDMPNTPKITSKSGYPILTEYGVIFDGTTTITYDKRTDIENYYSIDGTTWEKYTGSFQVVSGTIYAKSVKKSTGLEVKTSMTISMPSNALRPVVYDGNESTGISSVTQYLMIDSSMYGKGIGVKLSSSSTYLINIYDKNNTVIASKAVKGGYSLNNLFMTIPEGAYKLEIPGTNYLTIHEIEPYNRPVINVEQVYPTITEYGINSGYDNITVKYFVTSVQRLYKIDEGEWQTYQNKKIKLKTGETIYVKGIDKNGKETAIMSYKSVLPSDALRPVVYDGNESTGISSVTQYLMIDSSMYGKGIGVKLSSSSTYLINIYDKNNTVIASKAVKGGYSLNNLFMTIPEGAYKLEIPGTNYLTIHEIEPYNRPVINVEQVYPTITEYGINSGYDNITVKYFVTSVQRLYKIDEGEWQTYQNKKIKLKTGETIYVKGIDKNGKETAIMSYKSVLPSDALGTNAYDEDESTSINGYNSSGTKYIMVDSSLYRKDIGIKISVSSGNTITVTIYDKDNIVLASKTVKSSSLNDPYMTIPEGAYKISFPISNYSYVYEIKPFNE